MERIKPSDLEEAELKRVVRGYDMVEVHKLLQKAAQEIATLNYEIRQLKAENEKLNPLQDQANTLTDVILTAQKSAGEKQAKAQRDAEKIVSSARREADQIIAEAKIQCEEIEEQHKAQINDLRWHIERTIVEKDKIVSTYKSFLKEQLASIDKTDRKYVTLAVVDGDYLDDNESDGPIEIDISNGMVENEYVFEVAAEA